MTSDEEEVWRLYRAKRGPLNPMLRQESGFALLATMISRTNGGKADMADFMPWASDRADVNDITDVFNVIAGVTNGK